MVTSPAVFPDCVYVAGALHLHKKTLTPGSLVMWMFCIPWTPLGQQHSAMICIWGILRPGQVDDFSFLSGCCPPSLFFFFFFLLLRQHTSSCSGTCVIRASRCWPGALVPQGCLNRQFVSLGIPMNARLPGFPSRTFHRLKTVIILCKRCGWSVCARVTSSTKW